MARLAIEEENRNREGRMHAMLICTTLWGLFWLQFLVGSMFNHPALYSLSEGIWVAPITAYFVPSDGPLPFSPAGNFVLISLFGAVMALIGGWFWTRGIRGRWKLRLLVLGFAIWVVTWSLAAFAAENAAWTFLERERERVEAELTESREPHERQWLLGRREWIDATLARKPKQRD